MCENNDDNSDHRFRTDLKETRINDGISKMFWSIDEWKKNMKMAERRRRKVWLAQCMVLCIGGNGLCWILFWKDRQTKLAHHLNTTHYTNNYDTKTFTRWNMMHNYNAILILIIWEMRIFDCGKWPKTLHRVAHVTVWQRSI